MTITEDFKLAMAEKITAAFVNNKSVVATPEQAEAMFRKMYATVDELSKEKISDRKVGLG